MALNLLSMSIGGRIFFSMTSDIAPRARRAAYFTYQAMAFSICGIVGPLVGGFFFQSPRPAGGSQLGAGGRGSRSARRRRRGDGRSAARQPRCRLRGQLRDVRPVGPGHTRSGPLLSAISGFCAIPANLFGGRLADRIGRRLAVSVAQVLSGLLFVFDGLIHGGLFPSIDAMSADLCPSRTGALSAA